MKQVVQKPTPINQLLAEQARVREACQAQEAKLGKSMAYFQNNAGSLFFSGVSSLLFPGSSSSKKNELSGANAALQSNETTGAPFGFSDFLQVGKGMIPVLWEIAQPFLITWGIKKMKNLIGSAFSKKNKHT